VTIDMADKKKNIILIGPTPPPFTGQSLSFEMLINGLQEHGYNPFVVDISRKLVRYTRLPWLGRVAELIAAYFCLIRHLFLLRGRRVYITIAQSRKGFFRDFLYIWSCVLFRSKIFVHLKGGNYDGFYNSQGRIVRFLIKVTIKRVSKILVLGKSLEGMFDFEQSLKHKIKVIHNGLPNNHRGHSKSLSPKKIVKILFLSNLIESKGYMDIVRAMAILRDTYEINAVAHFAGEFMSSEDDVVVGSLKQKQDNFFDLVASLQLKNSVYFLGSVSGKNKWKLLQESHFFCLPTAYVNEGQPVSIIEAMAFGCVIVTTSFRAITDLIENHVNGQFVSYSNPNSIADAIANIICDQKYDDMSKESIRIFDKKFTREKHLENIIREIMG